MSTCTFYIVIFVPYTVIFPIFVSYTLICSISVLRTLYTVCILLLQFLQALICYFPSLIHLFSLFVFYTHSSIIISTVPYIFIFPYTPICLVKCYSVSLFIYICSSYSVLYIRIYIYLYIHLPNLYARIFTFIHKFLLLYLFLFICLALPFIQLSYCFTLICLFEQPCTSIFIIIFIFKIIYGHIYHFYHLIILVYTYNTTTIYRNLIYSKPYLQTKQ